MLEFLGNVSQTQWIYGGIGLIVLIAVILATVLLRRKKETEMPEPVPVSSADIPPLLTPPELACFNALYEVAGKEYHVMAKVSLSDIAIVKRGVDKQLLDKVSKDHHHIDFVLCTRDSIAVTCAIELQDASTIGKEVGPAQVLRQVGLPVFTLPRKTSYSATEIRKLLEPFLKERAPTPDEMVATISMEAFRVCNTCKTRMVLKRAKSGKYKGTLFWVCGKYPECRTIELFTR
ncbi:MAG TPA: DUF2726 domain-containing protein [Mariprofundaceae bacterium]|nr:DUF2726 domain-containing protein [Mariprofundaceae bacterium]